MKQPRLFKPSDPEVRKERVKLLAGGLNAIGVALVIGSAVGPLVDPSRHPAPIRVALGGALGASIVVAAIWILRYIKRQEAP